MHDTNATNNSQTGTQKVAALQNISNHNANVINFKSYENITDELNQSCSSKHIVRMSQNAMGKYVAQPAGEMKMSSRQAEQFETEEVSERQKTSSQTHYGATRAKAVLNSIINHEHHAANQMGKTEEEEKFQQTPEASTFHIIPENSLEISNSNKNSNTLDETKQFKEVVAPIKLADNQPLKLMDQFQSYNTQTGQNSNITTGKAVHEDCRQVI